MGCKIVVAPHSERKASGEPYKTKRHEYPVSQRGWRDAVRHAKSGSARGESSTIFMSCPRGDIRIAHCSDIGMQSGGTFCRLDAELGGNSTRVLAGIKREPPPVYHPRQGPPPGVPVLKGARVRQRK